MLTEPPAAHPNSLRALLRDFSLVSPVKSDLTLETVRELESELTEQEMLYPVERPRYAILFTPLLSLLGRGFDSFLASSAAHELSTRDVPDETREKLKVLAHDFQKKPGGYGKGKFVDQQTALSTLVAELVSLVDDVLPSELRAGVVETEYCHTLTKDEDDVAVQSTITKTEADVVFWRNDSVHVVVEEKDPVAHLEGQVLFRATDLTLSSPMKRLDDAFRARDRQVHDLLLKVHSYPTCIAFALLTCDRSTVPQMATCCVARNCRRFIFHDWTHYIVGFLFYLDSDDSAAGFDLVYSPLTPIDSVEYPLAQVTTSLFYSRHFFEGELRSFVNPIVVTAERTEKERTQQREKRAREPEEGGGQSEEEPDRKVPRRSQERAESESEGDATSHGAHGGTVEADAGTEPSGISAENEGATSSIEAASAVVAVHPEEWADLMRPQITSFDIIWPNGSRGDLPPFFRVDPHPSTPSPSSTNKKKPMLLHLGDYVGEGATRAVYRGKCASGDGTFILKLSLHPHDDDENSSLLHEAKMLSSPALRCSGICPRLYGVFTPSTAAGPDTPVALLMEDGGDDLEYWADLSQKEKCASAGLQPSDAHVLTLP